MSVWQTRAHFLAGGGHIVDNPAVGKALTEVYWQPGNSRPFLGLVEALTGRPLTGDSWVARLTTPLDTLLENERRDYDAAVAEGAAGAAGVGGEGKDGAEGGGGAAVDLDMQLRIVDGDEVIADSTKDGGFLNACATFSSYVERRFEMKS